MEWLRNILEKIRHKTSPLEAKRREWENQRQGLLSQVHTHVMELTRARDDIHVSNDGEEVEIRGKGKDGKPSDAIAWVSVRPTVLSGGIPISGHVFMIHTGPTLHESSHSNIDRVKDVLAERISSFSVPEIPPVRPRKKRKK